MKDPIKSLQGILFYLYNEFSANRIDKPEIEFINELNKSYGNCFILNIVLTQALNKLIKEKDCLRNILNNNIEIIDLLAKDYIIESGEANFVIKPFGLDKLSASLL